MFSRRWFRYVVDDGTFLAVNRDESTTELLNPAAAASANPTGLAPLSLGFKPRKILLKSAAGNSKSGTILTRAAYDAIQIGTTFTEPTFGETTAGTVFTVVLKNPEVVRGRPTALDTGMIDGDQP